MPEIPENTPGDSNRPKSLNGFPTSFVIVFLFLTVFLGFMTLRLIQTSQEEKERKETGQAATATATPAPTAGGAAKTSKYILFVPNDNALLNRETVTDPSTPGNAPYPQKARRALELLFPKLEFLPKGTKLRAAPVRENDGVIRIDLSREFMQLDSQHETPVMLTLDAIAFTLGAIDSRDGKTVRPAKVRILVGGESVRVLSQFSLDEPWKASETEAQTPDPEDAV